VPNIDYDIFGHNKFVFLPTDDNQEYRVEAIGLEEGSFDLAISDIENEERLSTQIFNDVSIVNLTNVSFEVSDSIENDSILVRNGDVVENVEADAVLEGSLAEDLVQPDTQIILTGKEYKDGEFKKEVDVSFIPTDNVSGVLGTWYSLNGQQFKKYTGIFTLGTEGLYNLRYYSVDRAGNNESIKIREIIIGKYDKYLRKLEKND